MSDKQQEIREFETVFFDSSSMGFTDLRQQLGRYQADDIDCFIPFLKCLINESILIL